MEPITLVTCSGLSSTGKVTARAGMVVLQRFPGSVEECIPAARLQEPVHSKNSGRPGWSLTSTSSRPSAGS